MNIINPNEEGIEEIILPVDDAVIEKLVQYALQCKRTDEVATIRDRMYKSKYTASGLERKELELEKKLLQLVGPNLRIENQNKEYKWVKINTQDMGGIAYRFYIAPNPNNLHEIVERLTETFSMNGVPVRFKYQLTTNMESCDRLIIYSDSLHRELVEETIKKVYLAAPALFNGCERSDAWLYSSDVPGVYFAPETPGEAYSNVLASVIIESKDVFSYLYGLTDKNNSIVFNGEEVVKAMNYMRMIVPSTLLKKGVLFSRDKRVPVFDDAYILTTYDYKTGVLKSSNRDQRGYYEVKYLPTYEGRTALLQNFYNVSFVKAQDGVETRYLTNEERREEVDRILNPHKYTQGSGSVPGKR